MDNIERSSLRRKELPYFQVENDIFDLDLKLTIHQKIVYIYLCRCSNNGSQAFPSYSTIAKKCGMSRRKAIDTINELIDLNLLEKQYRKNDQKNNSNIYVLNEPSAQDAPPSAQSAPPIVHRMHHPSAQDAPKKELSKNNNNINNKEKKEGPLSLFDSLRNNLSEVSFKTWIEPLVIKEAENEIIILVPNDFVKEILITRLLDKIKKCAVSCYGHNNIVFMPKDI